MTWNNKIFTDKSKLRSNIYLLIYRWNDAQNALQTLSLSDALLNQINHVILRTQYLEALSYHGGGGRKLAQDPWRPQHDNTARHDEDDALDPEYLIIVLGQLKTYCSKEVKIVIMTTMKYLSLIIRNSYVKRMESSHTTH
jgi:hypothetical protein